MNCDDFRLVHCYTSVAGGSLAEISEDPDDEVRRLLDLISQRWQDDKAKIQRRHLQRHLSR